MTHSLLPEEHAELRKLIQMSLDDRFTPEDYARLQEWVCRDEEAGRIYVQYMQLHARLHWSMTQQLESDRAGDRRAFPVPILGFLGDCFREGASFFSKPSIFAILVALGLPVLMLLLLAVSLTHQKPQQPLESVATIVRTCDSVGSLGNGNVRLSANMPLAQGQRLTLQSGLVEIEFADGAEVILQGPVEFRVVDDGTGFLHKGMLTAHVPMTARGFVIDTPVAKVVDLGTEFGLKVEDDRATEVHVFEGVVEAIQTGQGTDQAARELLRLERGTAARLDRQKGTILEQPADPTQFVRKMPSRGVTDRPFVRNPSFEYPNVVKHSDYNAEMGYVNIRPMVGWKESDFNGQYAPNTYCQLAPFRSPNKSGHYDVFPGASDGRQVAMLTLRKFHPVAGPVKRTWIYQSLGNIQASDVGKTLQLQVDVCARNCLKISRKRDGAKATVAFALNASEKDPGTVVGTPGVDNEVLVQEGFHILEATLAPEQRSVGQDLFVLLMVEGGQLHSKDHNYMFDNVRCRVVGR